MKTVHYFSGLTICLFIGFHILNHLMILQSEAAHLGFMKKARKIYRNPVIESVLLIAVLSQIITGLLLVIFKWNKAEEFFEWLQIFSGLYLSFFLVNHVLAVMRGRYKLHLDTNLYYGAGVMNRWPQKLFFIPYYFFSLLSFFFHVASIHRFKIENFVGEAAAKMHGYIIISLGIVIATTLIVKMSRLKNYTISADQLTTSKDK